MRYTRDEMLQTLRNATAREIVYKTEVDTLKSDLSNVYDRSKYAINEEFTHAGKWQNLSAAEREVDLPYSLIHLFGKKFLTSLDTAKQKLGGTTPYLDAIGHMVSELSPLNTLMQALIARQVKGRRPPEPKKVIATRLQYRAICPCCFREQAVDGDAMVAHGYTLEYGYQNGNCSGRGKPHFGTTAGRAVTEGFVMRLMEQATKDEDTAKRIRAGDESIPCFDSKFRKIEKPTKLDRDMQVSRIEGRARNARMHASFLEQQITQWQPKEPREVVVEVTE